MITQRDFVVPGNYFSADYLRQTELDGSGSFQSFYSLISAADKNASDSDVQSAGAGDVSPVYRVQSKNPKYFYRAVEYTENQTATPVVDPSEIPSDAQMVVTYVSVRSESSNGTVYLHNSDSSIIFGLLYLATTQRLIAGNVRVPLGAGEGIYVTSTQGSKGLFVVINAYFERIG